MTDQATQDGAAFDAGEYLKGNVDDVKAKLGERSWADLDALGTAEAAGAKRAGVTQALDAERKARGDEHAAAFDLASQSAERAGTKIYDQAAYDSASQDVGAERDKLTADNAALQAKLDDATTAHEAAKAQLAEAGDAAAERDKLAKDNAALQAKLDAAQTKLKGTQPPKARKAPSPRKLEGIAAKADFGGATTIAFADASGFGHENLPDLEFAGGDFVDRQGGKLLQQAIDLPATGPTVTVSSLFLLDGKGNVAAVSPLQVPLQVGGGRGARLPARSVLFRADAPVPDAQDEKQHAAHMPGAS